MAFLRPFLHFMDKNCFKNHFGNTVYSCPVSGGQKVATDIYFAHIKFLSSTFLMAYFFFVSRYGRLIFSFFLIGLTVNSQPAPVKIPLFTQHQDSCINPKPVMDSLFLPRLAPKRVAATWQWQQGKPLQRPNSDIPFYIMSVLFLFTGLTLRTFPKYFQNLNRLFFQSGFRQKSIRDQLVQNKTASLAANTLFFFSTGTYLFILANQFGKSLSGLWYAGLLTCVAVLLIIYLVKYLALLLGGWIFNAKELANQYAFIVFFINKIVGLFLLPVTVVLWFGKHSLHPYTLVISYLVLFFLFVYRYFLILPILRRQADISAFHFFIYLCSFELVPILLLVKVLMNYLPNSN